jgi:hypothetical protein
MAWWKAVLLIWGVGILPYYFILASKPFNKGKGVQMVLVSLFWPIAELTRLFSH